MKTTNVYAWFCWIISAWNAATSAAYGSVISLFFSILMIIFALVAWGIYESEKA